MADLNSILNELRPNYEEKTIPISEIPGSAGVNSIFNKYVVFSVAKSTSDGTPGTTDTSKFLDLDTNVYNTADDPLSAGGSYPIYLTPTADNIIKWSKSNSENINSLLGNLPYSWSDFLFCKYYGLVPNNHMITLRRYHLPVWDSGKLLNVNENDQTPPIAQAITYFGEKTGNKLDEIFSFTYGLKWKDVESTVQEIDGNEKPFGVGLEGIIQNNRLNTFTNFGLAMYRGDLKRYSGQLEKEQQWSKNAFGSNGPYWNEVLGPVNVINKTKMRDMGMEFQHSIKLKFDFNLNAYAGINPKVAMLDLISNMLLLTYNNAKFFGGAMRYFPQAQDQVLFLGGQKAQRDFYDGNWSGYFEGATSELKDMLGTAADGFMQALSSGNIMDLLKNIAGKALQTAGAGLARKSQPAMLSIRNLLSGLPIGEWHLTIGNPMNPIAMIGNLIIKDTAFKPGNILGADDFFTEVSFTITLEHGKPRDKSDIESIFNTGRGRMFYTPFAELPSERGTHGDHYKQDGNYSQKDNNADINKTKDNIQSSAAHIDDIKGRITSEWGKAFGSESFQTIFNRTKFNF